MALPVCDTVYADTTATNTTITTTIQIPQGYILAPNEDDEVKITATLNLDSSQVKLFEEIATYNVEITPDGATGPVTTEARIRELGFSGAIFYNSIVSLFEPASSLTDSNRTAFTNPGTITVNEVIIFAGYDCEPPTDWFEGFKLMVSDPKISVIDYTGTQTELDTQETTFYEKLADPTHAKTLHITYTADYKKVD